MRFRCPSPCSVSTALTRLRVAPFGLLDPPGPRPAMAGPSRHRPEASMFSGSANPTFRDSEFKAAGHDFFNSPTFNVHFTAPFSELSTTQGELGPDASLLKHHVPAGELDRPMVVAPFKQFRWLLGFLTHRPQPLPESKGVSDPELSSLDNVGNPIPSSQSSKHDLPPQKKRKRTSPTGPPPTSKRHRQDDVQPAHIQVVGYFQIAVRASSYLS